MGLSRRKLLSSVMATSIIPLLPPTVRAQVTSRTLLQASAIFYCGTGTTFGSITGLVPNFPTVQAAANNLYSAVDCGGQQIEIRLLDGTVDPGFRFSGLLVGQRGLGGVVVRGSALGSAIIRPSGSSCAIAMDSGAQLSIAELQMDGGVQGAAGTPQDVVQLGQGAKIAFYGSNRIIQYGQMNGITVVNSSVDFYPQSWGSQTQNGGHLYVQGVYQDFIQTDQGAQIEVNVNDQHGLFEIHPEASSYRAKPYCGVAWLDVADGVILMSGTDASGGVGGDGYKVRYRKFGTVDFGLPVNPNDWNNFLAAPGAPHANNLYPGSVNGAVI